MPDIRCKIYRSNGDSSNGGISSTNDGVILVFDGDEEELALPQSQAGTPRVKLVRRCHGSSQYLHAEPIEPCPKGHVGYMAGGTFIWTNDSRFPHDCPISLHDRSEDYELYQQLSS
jgi:hypothetical protein